MTGPLRLIVFDVDGTLVDSQAHIIASMESAFAGIGLPSPSRDAILGIVGLSLPVAIPTLVPDADVATHRALVEGYKTSYMTLRSNDAAAASSPLYPGARDALDRLGDRPEVLLGVATGKSRRGLDHVLDQHGWKARFITQQVADDHPSKPHPSMLQAALSETGAEGRDAVMIGDTEYDILMGRAAGFRTIGVSWGYHDLDRLNAAGADQIIGSFNQLLAALDDMMERDG
ncbi:HAD-IA family hydrolase [Aliiroseovarius sp. YM-037]|uniref:HAD-IA family hydrolase n=1 Tax=Aliiroseovarius sp. YM-037 TaxID=3341728 RepID=UPI003A7FA9D2